jgi:hypothetical protein
MPRHFCWAAYQVHGIKPDEKGVVCRIEGQFVPEKDNSYWLWCHGDYTTCPTWRSHNAERWRDREHDIEQRRQKIIEERYGPADAAADSFVEGTGATIDDVLDTGI